VNITDRHADFALALIDAVPAATHENVVVSPWSVSSALAVLAPGCDPPSREEVERALVGNGGEGGSDAPDEIVAGLAADAATIAENAATTEEMRPWSGESLLTVANSLWVDEGRTPLPAFTAALDRWPGAALRFAPIAADPDGTRRAVNADVAATTRNLIPNVLPAGALTPDDRAVLVNALYLLAPWTLPFAASRTEDAPFHGPGGTRAVPTMCATHDLVYARGEWEYVGLALGLGFVAEVLLPPPGSVGVSALPDPATLRSLRLSAQTHRVDLHLPRLRVERATELIGPLRALGVRRIFSGLPVVGVVAEENLWITGAYHSAVLRVDETGIEGAAATALVMRQVAYRQLPTVEVRVDRPFLLLVTHRQTGAMAFIARVREP
jgi:serpin B